METAPEKTPEEFAAEQAEAEADAQIVSEAQAFYRMGMSASSEWRQEAITDLEFLAGEQWDPSIKGQRDAQGRPALTVNRLPQFVRQITNEQRQSKPAVTVNPVDSGSDVRTAEVLQGIIRNIEYTSNADAAYAAGGQSAAITGLGYWDVCAEYEDERSFEQRLSIKRISNPMSVVFDPGAKEIAGDDARKVIISTDTSEGEFKSRHPGVEMPKSSGWKGEGDTAASWVAKDGVRIHEYRYIKEEPDTLIDDPEGGEPVLASEMAAVAAAMAQEQTGAPLPQEEADSLEQRIVAKAKATGIATRPTTRRKACWAKIAGDTVIEKGELAGRYLQLVRVVGTELEIDGETIYEGVIRHARDTQRMLNYFVSAEAEAIALTPKAPWLIAEGQIGDFEAVWATANSQTHSHLPYKPIALGGHPVPPPMRVMSEANVSSITNARMQAADDLKAVTGIYDGQLGARSNETSGRAILARQSQGQTANFHFQDNLALAIRYTGRIEVDLIPKIYTGPRTLRILGEDGKQEMVPVNGQPGELPGKLAAEPGDINLNAGRYDVAVSMGPSYHSRRQEASAQMVELIKVNPVVANVAGDLLVENLDLPNGKAIAERIRKTLPPEIRPPDEKQPPAAMLAQKVSQLEQMNQQMMGRLNEMSANAESKVLELQSSERKDLIAKHVDLAKAFASAAPEDEDGRAVLAMEMRRVDARLDGYFPPAPELPQQPQQQMPQQPMSAPQGGI